MSDEIETIKWYLTELSCQDGNDIESNEIEIYGEDENGADGCFTIEITDIAEKALNQITKLEKVVDVVFGVFDEFIESVESSMPQHEDFIYELSSQYEEINTTNHLKDEMQKAIKEVLKN